MTHRPALPPNARCTECGRLLYRHTLAVPDPTPIQQRIADLPHRGCGGRVVPLRQETRS